jgi:N-acetylneuraminic acid mutarotase
MNNLASCAAAFLALAVTFGANAQDPSCGKNHYILSGGAATWVATGSLNVARSAHTATLLPDGKVLVVGGFTDSSTGVVTLDSAELYDPATRSWTFTGSLAQPRAGHAATLLPNGRVLVVGGGLGTETAGTAELYDPATGAWTPTGSLNTPREAFTATLLATGKVLVAGGVDSSDETLRSAELYDPVTETWSYTEALLWPRLLHTATALQDGRVLVVGGWDSDFNQLSIAAAELYDPVAGTWSSALPLSQARAFHTATGLEDGRVLVAGGYQSVPTRSGYRIPTALAGAEVFDPITDTWQEVANMNESHEGHTATLLPDGEVLVAGGAKWGPYGTISGTEGYESTTATWTPIGNLVFARSGHTATLLLDGTVLVAGGDYWQSPRNVSLNSAELYVGSAIVGCQ